MGKKVGEVPIITGKRIQINVPKPVSIDKIEERLLKDIEYKKESIKKIYSLIDLKLEQGQKTLAIQIARVPKIIRQDIKELAKKLNQHHETKSQMIKEFKEKIDKIIKHYQEVDDIAYYGYEIVEKLKQELEE